MRIEICGGIASGKTTLATLLKRRGHRACLEDFQANPFWRAFYSDPGRFAFETEVAFLLQHYHQIKISKPNPLVCDFSLILDRSYVDVTLRGRRRAAFLQLYDCVWREVGPPSLIVHLVCSAAEELRRIRRRARKVETSISITYLSNLNRALEKRVQDAERSTPVLRIDSARRNFSTNKKIRREVVEEIAAMLNPH